MKPFKKRFDHYHRVETKYYKLDSGLIIIQTTDSQTVETNVDIAFKSGSYFERELNVPDGTAHFLEHILAGNPNATYKTRKKFERLYLGDRNKPFYSRNAFTNYYVINFFAEGHEKAKFRIFDDLIAQISMPHELFSKYIERERAIIKAEISKKENIEMDGNLAFDKFFYGNIYPDFAKRIIGTFDTVDAITVEDLSTFYTKTFRSDDCFVAITSSDKNLDKRILNKIKKLDSHLLSLKNTEKPKLQIPYKTLPNKFRFGHFTEPTMEGVFMSINFFMDIETPKTFDIKEDRLTTLFRAIAHRVMHEELREDKNIVYGFERINRRDTLHHIVKGLNFTFEYQNIDEVLETTYDVYYKKIEEFLNSKQGKEWLDNQISFYIFRTDDSISRDFTYGDGFDMIFDLYIDYNYKKAQEVMKKITIEDVRNYYKKTMKNHIPSLWFNSKYKQDKILKKVMNSKFYKNLK